MSVEAEIKAQYARLFVATDWPRFKSVGDHYLETAARLKRHHIRVSRPPSLLTRNIRKRLFLGIGCELVLKAFYLKNGFCINKPKSPKAIATKPPYRLSKIRKVEFLDADTVTLNYLIDHMNRIADFDDLEVVKRGFKIAKVFRNKEGHVAVFQHHFVPQNYKDITGALEAFYPVAFSEKLKFHVSLRPRENAQFALSRFKLKR